MKANADTLLIVASGSLQKWDFNGTWVNMDWEANMNQDLQSHNWKGIHFYEDESFIAAGWTHLDSFPAKYELVKMKPNGRLDTSFIIDAMQGWDQYVDAILYYNEDHFIVSGGFSSWLGYPIENICRINSLDASIDTSFQSIFARYGLIRPLLALPDGKVIIGGWVMLSADSTVTSLVRINPDGSLDSTFNNFNGPGPNSSVVKLCPTPDGGYLVGGYFKSYQGYPRGNIAKIDADGFLDTTVFTGAGFDTVGYNPAYSPGCVYEIIPAQNNKYYVGGQFNLFNGEEVKSIVRIFGETGDAVPEMESNYIYLFPNPAKEILIIKSDFFIQEIEIFSLNGWLVRNILINSKHRSLCVSDLFPGSYILRAIGKERVWEEKFVVIR